MDFKLSEIDQQRFGVVTAKVSANAGDTVHEIIEKSRDNQVEFLIIRVPTDQLEMVQELELEGAFLTDTLVYYEKNKMELYPDGLLEGYTKRLATEKDAEPLGALALKTFQDYLGHYHVDQKLKKTDCDLVYSSWAANSCIKNNMADAVILIENNNELVAFATIKSLNQNEFEGVLFGVSPNHRGKGLHISLMKLSQNWGVDSKHTHMITSTQITNAIVQRNWCRLGFELKNSYYTLHKWFK